MIPRNMPRGICSFTSARPCEHDSRGSQHQRPDGRHNPCSTCSCPNIEVQQHQAQADTCHIISQRRHNIAQETPAPTYIGMMLHVNTCKRALIDRLSHLDISISYDRVLQLSTQTGESVFQQFHREQVVCPPTTRGKVFTTAAIDNIDHNPSSTTAKESFHGTGISLLQHPSFVGERVDRSTVFVEGSVDEAPRTLATCHTTTLSPVTTSLKHSTAPATTLTPLDRENFKKQTAEEYLWQDNAKKVLVDNTLTPDNASWAVFHASCQSQEGRVICPTALLPLFLDSAHTVAMIRHSIDVVTIISILGRYQLSPLIGHLFALAKQIQWTWSESYGEDKLVVMFGGLHIEMAALKIGTADFFL